MLPKPLVVSALIPLLFAGCATQDSLTEQTRPMQDRLDRLELALKASTEAGQARQARLDDDIDGLKSAVKVLVARLGEQGGETNRLAANMVEDAVRQSALTERVAQAEMRLDELATAGRESADGTAGEIARLAERSTQSELRLDELATMARASADQPDEEQRKLAERLAQTEARLNEFATAMPERMARMEQRLDGVSGAVREALTLAAQENIRLNGKEAFSVLLTEDKTLYPINSPELGSQDVAKLDDLVDRLARLEQDYHLDIQGHTDNIGTEDYNYELGKARADVVKRYLSERKGISLSRMSVISYGAGNPVDRTGNRNRRIAIRVLVLK